MRTLYLKQIEYKELCNKWGYKPYSTNSISVLLLFNQKIAYIRARKDGSVNWDKSTVYKPSELKGRLIFIHK